MKNHRHDDSGMRKTDRKISKHKGFKKPNKSEYKEEKEIEEEPQASFLQKSKLREFT